MDLFKPSRSSGKPLLANEKGRMLANSVGIESGHDEVLDFISKGITQEKIKSAITAAHEVGLRPKAFFMVGHMPDTRESILETIRFAKSIPLHDITVQINTLLQRLPNSIFGTKKVISGGALSVQLK